MSVEKTELPEIHIQYANGPSESRWADTYRVIITRDDGRPLSVNEIASVFQMALRNPKMVTVDSVRGDATLH